MSLPLKVAPLGTSFEQASVLFVKIRQDLKSLTNDKHSSLLCLTAMTKKKSFVTLTADVWIAGSPFYFFILCIPQIREVALPGFQIKNSK
jgi:hypothetical protein